MQVSWTLIGKRTRLQSKCQPGLQPYLRLSWRRNHFEDHVVIDSIYFLVAVRQFC